MSVGAVGSCQGPSQAWRDKMFAKADTDGDKKLSLDEFTALTQKMGSGKGAPPPDAAGATDKPDAAAMFKSFDTDGDGSLSQTELDSGFDAIHEAMASAVKKHKSGDSGSLIDMLFGKNDDPSSTDDATSGITSASDTTDSPFTDDSTSSTSSSASDLSSSSDSSSGLDTSTMRLQQWMLDAFSSQFNVSNVFANAA